RGLLLEPLAGDAVRAQTILVPHLFDRAASEVEVMQAADPFAATQEPIVELLREPRVVERSSSYLQIVLDATGAASDGDNAVETAANDDLALAAGSED